MADPIPSDLQLAILGPRRLRVFFHTSSTDKFLQARHLFAKYAVIIEHFPQHTEPYSEDYSADKETLLRRAVDEVRKVVGSGVIFFVEDTSLRIEALSSSQDFPGLAVKEWFPSTTFDQLDADLRRNGNDRRATVKSGIALHIPGRAAPLYFYGETEGIIASTPPVFPGSPLHPWLNPKTFDGWLIPAGSTKRLAEMTADESLRLHFRAQALRKLLERLNEYSAILNLPPTAFHVRREGTAVPQLTLFRGSRRRWVVVGPRAAGKTTFGEIAANKLKAEHFEASTIIRSFYREVQPSDRDVTSFAADLHKQYGNDVVVRKLLDDLGLADSEVVALTGLRKLEELDYLHRIGFEYHLIYIQATPRTRYDRYIQRARDDDRMDFRTFTNEERDLELFLSTTREYADVVIDNEFELDYYLRQVSFTLGLADAASPLAPRPRGLLRRDTRSNPTRNDPLLLQCLSVMVNEARPLTVEQISLLLPHPGRTSPETISRTLRKHRDLYTGSTTRHATLEIAPAGEMYWRVVRARLAANR